MALVHQQYRSSSTRSAQMAVSNARTDCPIGLEACIFPQQQEHAREISIWSSHHSREVIRTCIRGICLGLLSMSILRNPTPTAPEETMITLCPSLCSFTPVSTIRVRIERI